MELLDKIEEYWTGRAEGYSQVNQGKSWPLPQSREENGESI